MKIKGKEIEIWKVLLGLPFYICASLITVQLSLGTIAWIITGEWWKILAMTGIDNWSVAVIAICLLGILAIPLSIELEA